MNYFDSDAAIVIQTPAKLNLFLELLAKRPDGFHEIETLMSAINIYDRLYVTSLSEGQTQLTCRWASGMEALSTSRNGSKTSATLDELPMGSDNIVWKAVEQLRLRAGIAAGIAIHLVKRIPAAAGLGGASSDAAAALVAANRLWGLGWTRNRLAEVAAEIGSDIPFFLAPRTNGAGMAVCRGRGEQIEPLAGMPQLHFVLTRPPVGLSTPGVYQRCKVPAQPKSAAPLIEKLRSGDHLAGQLLVNRLQPPAEELSPWIRRMSELFAKTDCVGHQMSGSGSSYFGICRSARHARCLATRIRAAGYELTFQVSSAPHLHRIETKRIETAPL
ncbi:MAG: 4-(cytidine 5'-diphospho)-2-C-methyl-D-erythritol kinase [Planctomycetaceae bacterium]|nr:4-(cytidine 5'-diphospho)-2-C-methyl-D-erythritol kinase [Planctomycetales bacterium]MCB9925832.1 4-(cytidine 5'-diphospho)-2-C-methyl-D-erythritol kinase [Planctomycetaceae bacterium]